MIDSQGLQDEERQGYPACYACAKDLLSAADDSPLINYRRLGYDAMLAVPTPDHYLPLLYVMGCRNKGEELSFPIQGVDGGSISMLSIQIG